MAILSLFSYILPTLFFSFFVLNLIPSSCFDVRHHLSTVTSYDAGKEANLLGHQPSSIPDGCTPIHLNLVARHGTRAPTKKRIKELDLLANRLRLLVNEVKQGAKDNALQSVPPWLHDWKSPWEGRKKGGELVSQGESELYELGIRTRQRFPEIFNEEYHPDVFNIRATQVTRASASAVAFGIGLFSEKGSLGPGKHRAFSVISESRASDIWLRFHDNCETYKEYRKSQEPAVDKLKEPILDEITSELVTRYKLNFTTQDVTSLWFLCKQEASLLHITDQACGLFNDSEVSLLEWTDDLEVFLLKGYGNSINYHMGIPLLKDILQSMEQAIMAKEENITPGTFEKARLRFAHAETVIPFICLLGLFLGESEFEQIRQDKPLDLPPRPPHKRKWVGSAIAPFAGNNMLLTYYCPGSDLDGIRMPEDYKSKYFVQALHNEIPVHMPGCDNRDFCPFEVFKEKVAMPHMTHEFEALCNSKPQEKKLDDSQKHCSIFCKLSEWFHRICLQKESSKTSSSESQKTEL